MRAYDARRRPDFRWGPPVDEPVTVIVPAYNEIKNIEATVRSIVANEANDYTEEELAEKQMKELRKLSKLAANSGGGGDDDDAEWGNYIGANTPEPTTNSRGEDRFLEGPDLFTVNEDRSHRDREAPRRKKRAKARV